MGLELLEHRSTCLPAFPILLCSTAVYDIAFVSGQGNKSFCEGCIYISNGQSFSRTWRVVKSMVYLLVFNENTFFF